MKPTIDTVIHLLHSASSGTLATHSTQMPGYPFATALPFATDEQHYPVFLVSRLAEHTKNLVADSRVSFMVSNPNEGSVLTGARLTLVGDAARIDATPELVARYLRYQPDAEQYLSLGDFTFFQLQPKRVRYIAGFGQMGWVEEAEWTQAAILPLVDEAICLRDLTGVNAPGVRLLGLDCYGADVEQQGKRDRLRLAQPVVSAEKLTEGMQRLLAAM
ncbi:MAG TPA: pyridoxamine 5'-phosphate oxidase family protein [Noviherbaspirillum sp.]|nr:pyridoxamine 5'-phosphate oxidase family protein [Noviherbaspirillum sp.]